MILRKNSQNGKKLRTKEDFPKRIFKKNCKYFTIHYE